MYTLKTWKTWNTQTSQPSTRTDLPYALARALAVNGGYAKAQVIDQEFDTVTLETREDPGWPEWQEDDFHQENQP